MGLKIEFSRNAQNDLDEITGFLNGTGARKAALFIDELHASIASLADYPDRYSVVPEFAGIGLRRCIAGSYSIFYLKQDRTIYVVRVLHGARDLVRHLAGEL